MAQLELEARASGVEIGIGAGFPDADVVIEVDSADAAFQALRERGAKLPKQVESTDWGARMFTLKLPAGFGQCAIFSYENKWREDETGIGKLDASGKRFAIVVARFNAFITERLLEGALEALAGCGAYKEDIEIVRVPGSFETRSSASIVFAFRSPRFDPIPM